MEGREEETEGGREGGREGGWRETQSKYLILPPYHTFATAYKEEIQFQ